MRQGLTGLPADSAELVQWSTADLRRKADARARGCYGMTVTYSPKVFIPLTTWCRDACGYCTFADGPKRQRAPFLTVDEVLAFARQGVAAGCHEALFTLGEAPESRYPQAQEWLAERGFDSTVDYLVSVAAQVREETGLLPHLNPGTLDANSWSKVRDVAVSAGAMLETIRDGLPAHRGAPDKTAAKRLQMLDTAGQLKIPFTTGLLVGIGDSEADRIQALLAVRASHERHGHIHEVIIQNFLPKQGTAMVHQQPCPVDDHLRTIALARLILPTTVHIQAPPNLADDPFKLICSGIDDLGGISPVTIDHVNPERPWPHVEDLEKMLTKNGFELRSRLPLHPEYAARPEEVYVHSGDAGARLAAAVYRRADACGFARSDPGSLPAGDNRSKGAVHRMVSRSPMWAAGVRPGPPTVVGQVADVSARIRAAVDGVLAAATLHSTDRRDVEALLTAHGADLKYVANAADELRADLVGADVTFVRNANINYTNVCTFSCGFCAFSKGPRSTSERDAPYLLDRPQLSARIQEALAADATEVCLQGGIHPHFDGQTYLKIAKQVAAEAPTLHIHAFSALEVYEAARREGVSLGEYVQILKAAGVKTIPGTAAEILHDEVRAEICADKISADEWVQVHRAVHAAGMASTVTIMFGHREQPHHVVEHLFRVAELQSETGGFTEFVPLPFVHHGAPIFVKGKARRGPTWSEVVALTATSRLFFGALLPNVQASWVKCGLSGAGQLLQAGANDLGGTLLSESISRAAGAEHGQYVSAAELNAVLPPGRTLVQRRTDYTKL